MKTLYTTSATAQGGRHGHVESSDGVVDLALSMPEGLGGAGGEGTNPEQLFAAGYAACFENALRLVASQRKIDIADASITAQVQIGRDSEGAFNLAAKLNGYLPNLSKEEAEELMEQAHGICPYSRATQGNIDVELSVDG